MINSLVFLTASWISGQAAPAYIAPMPVAAPVPVMANGTVLPAGSYAVPEEQAPKGFFQRLRTVFHKQPASQETLPAGAVIIPQGQPTTAEPPHAGGIIQTSLKQTVPMVQKKFRDQVGNAEDYSWITGQLFYVHGSGGGVWVLRYTSLGQEDIYGGSMILEAAVEMKNYREGDLVCVEGGILQDRKAPRGLGGALYRANTITMINRADN